MKPDTIGLVVRDHGDLLPWMKEALERGEHFTIRKVEPMTDEQAQEFVLRAVSKRYRDPLLREAIRNYGAWERARAVADLGCSWSKIDGGKNCAEWNADWPKLKRGPCDSCKAQAALAAAEQAMQEGATA